MTSASSESTLPRRFVLYVPADRGAALVRLIELVLCSRLGGVTSYPAQGTFRMEDGRRISEGVQVLESYCEAEEWGDQHPFLMALAQVTGQLLGQASIACAIDGRMKMVAPSGSSCSAPCTEEPGPQSEEALTSLVLRQLTAQQQQQ